MQDAVESGLGTAMLRLHPTDIRPQSAANVHKQKQKQEEKQKHPQASIADYGSAPAIFIPLDSEKSDFNCGLLIIVLEIFCTMERATERPKRGKFALGINVCGKLGVFKGINMFGIYRIYTYIARYSP